MSNEKSYASIDNCISRFKQMEVRKGIIIV